ncbi:spore gernimation protein [Halobacillus halophilus]|uniref:Spore germination protein n=1 Tax=Halobacillus halophilus (strain ATCC 35676 / DSM 2266 / JCM 20832 / KCTC 3685 / LMG 17431 / NBRC 102448 / NCIMB 2269) TaxID=866895 RepID=I0JK08_HALH3|nr:GerAB/ArcD/ProY family transporter [Halobacillus halophilus]ASF38626.1 spore gernimation protein [Halobacillus halophilus]CCG44477.1 spore germination protein [Halobacillus halophilus DSM 2266]
MNTNLIIKPDKAVEAFYLFFIVHTLQIGAGLMGVPRVIFTESGADSWIAILLAGIYLHFVAWIMILILRKYDNADIIGIQCDVFGRWLGRTLGIVYVIYLFFILLTVIKNYIEVVQVFIFPEIPLWLMSGFLLSLMIYAVIGGFRVVVGTSFIFFLLTIWMVLTLAQPISYMDWDHFTPILHTGAYDLLKGAYKTAYSVLGLEILFFVYPYIKNKQNIALPVHAGLALTTFLILLVTVVSIGYFSPEQLKETVWATLSLFKIISYPIVERFDFIAIALWMMVIIPNIVLFCWALIQSLKRLFQLPEKPSLYGVALLLFGASILVEYRVHIDQLTDWTSTLGFWLVFVYPVILYPLVLIRKRFRKENSI